MPSANDLAQRRLRAAETVEYWLSEIARGEYPNSSSDRDGFYAALLAVRDASTSSLGVLEAAVNAAILKRVGDVPQTMAYHRAQADVIEADIRAALPLLCAAPYQEGYAEGCKRQYSQHEAHAIGYAAGCAAQAQEVERLREALDFESTAHAERIRALADANRDLDALRQQLAEAREALTPEEQVEAMRVDGLLSSGMLYGANPAAAHETLKADVVVRDHARRLLRAALRALGGATA